MTVVIMIMLSVMLFSGNGVERRTHDRLVIDNAQQIVSPLLATHR